jgi:hypothetical protein
MFRALLLTFALGLTPALAEDIGSAQIIEDFAFTCDGPCPEAGPIAMSSDEDGDGEAEYVTFTDEIPCDTTCEAQADASRITDAGSAGYL